MTTRHHVDTWRTTIGRVLEDARAHVLDIIDRGPTDPPSAVCDCQPGDRCDDYPKCRRAPAGLRYALDPADGNFRPTPKAPSRRGDPSDPTFNAAATWESAVQQATTRILQATDTALDVAAALGLRPCDEHGNLLIPPADIPMRTTKTLRQVIDTAPTMTGRPDGDDPSCRTVTLQCVAYVAAVADRLADRWRHTIQTTDPRFEDPYVDSLERHAQELTAAAYRAAPPQPRLYDEPDGLTECDCTSDLCDHGPAGCGSTYMSRHRQCRGCRRRNRLPQQRAG